MPEEVGEENWDKLVDARCEGRARGFVGKGLWGVEYIHKDVFGDGRHRPSWLLLWQRTLHSRTER